MTARYYSDVYNSEHRSQTRANIVM
uniref:Uncharacterized protein n=1 Tax=Anguilla anguilla TaxID=7936 RepID=A0A0E9UHB2_ANGAN